MTSEVIAPERSNLLAPAPWSGLASWLRALRPRPSGEVAELTDQFYLTLRASFSRVRPELNRAATQRIEQLLKDRRPTWTAAYEIEQLLVLLYDEDSIRSELEVRLLEAQRVLRKELADHYSAEAQALTTAKVDGAPAPNPGATTERLRVLLARLVNDLQWRYTVDEAKRRYSKIITSRTALLSVLSLLAFASAIGLVAFTDLGLLRDDVRLFLFAALAGTWGATFSLLANLRDHIGRSSLDELKLSLPRVTILSRALIGACAGSILYFFVLSGLLGGSAFPDLGSEPGGPLPNRILASLIVWCFIAGFSERLVPSILERTESRAGTEGDRFRPEGSTAPAGSATANGTATRARDQAAKDGGTQAS